MSPATYCPPSSIQNLKSRIQQVLLLAFTLLVLAAHFAGCSSGPVIVVYSPHGPDVLNDYKKLFEEAHPGVEVHAIDAGAEEVYSRISAERNRPQADVWWGAPSTKFMQAAKENLLEAYHPSWADSVDPAYKDSSGLWYGTYRSPIGIVYNSRRYKAAEIPDAWDGLLDPRWKGKITIRKPLASGTMRTFIGAMILRSASEDAGMAWLKNLHGQVESYMENPQLLYDHIKRQDDLISVWLLPDVVLQRERNGYPFECVVPKQTPVLTEGIAIVKGAPHPDLAREFYEFVTTREALAHQAKAYAKIPVRTDMEPASLPSWIAQLTLDPLPIDWTSFAANEKQWVDRWASEVFNAP